jgi:hypothetical protein
MIDAILNLPEYIGRWILVGIINAINLIIAGIGALLSALFLLLPDLPDVPENPAPDATGYIAYFIPATSILAFAALLITAYTAILVIRIALRWVKAL